MDEDNQRRLHDELFQQTGNSSDPFASAVRTTRMPMVVTDPRQADNPIVFCNDAFVHLTGYAREEIVGRNCRFLQGPATRAEDVARIRHAIERREAVQVDLLNHRKDGTTFWNALLISPVFDGDELTFFFASQLDVTDRKRAEEHRFLLHRELDHRVKNTLATVQSVVIQSLQRASVPSEVADAVAGRIRALARTHDVLSVEAWASADMRDVIESAMEPFQSRFASRIAIDGPALRIKSRVATMLSLGVHELADNAVRHGAFSAAAGKVQVSWTLADHRIRLEWRETGGPPVTQPTRRGYGAQIVERVLAAEFGGDARIEFARDGIVFRLNAPAEDLGDEASEWRME